MGTNQSLPKVTAQDRAILDMKLQRDKLKQYQKKIQGVLDREGAIAKAQLAAGNKDRALIALRRRKYQQSLLSKTDDQLVNLEQLVTTIEFSLVEVSVVHGLKQGNEVLKQIHKEMNIESVEKLLEETAEAREYQREMSEMLANTLTVEEEEDVQKELLAIQQDVLGENSMLTEDQFPTIPETNPNESIKQDATVETLKEPVKRERVLVPG